MKVRETAVNILIGLLLLVAFAVPFAAVLGAVGLALYGLDLAVKHFLPGVSVDVEFFALICFLSISAGISHLKKRLWSSALLAFSIIAVVLPVWFRDGKGLDSSAWFLLPLFTLLLIAENRGLRHWKLGLGGALVVAGFLLNTGLVSGTLARPITVCSSLAIGAWMVIQIRRGQFAGVRLDHLSQTKT